MIKIFNESEVSIANEHQRVWKDYIQPFFDAKSKELYEAFCDTSVSDVEVLTSIKQHYNVLQSMEGHFKHYINSGKLAKEQLKRG